MYKYIELLRIMDATNFCIKIVSCMFYTMKSCWKYCSLMLIMLYSDSTTLQQVWFKYESKMFIKLEVTNAKKYSTQILVFIVSFDFQYVTSVVSKDNVVTSRSKVYGFNPSSDRWIFQDIKICNTSLPGWN